MKKPYKTNAMRILDRVKADYKTYFYGDGEAIPGDEVARELGADPARVFKTLVTVGASKANYVFMIPVTGELDLKKAAKAVGEKNIVMIKSKELLPLTGYIHGGCSPIGMKKQFVTTVHESAGDFETIFFSGGRIGCQVELSLDTLKGIVPLKTADLLQ